MREVASNRIFLKIRSVLLLIALILPVNGHAGTLQRLVEGADSGKIAKFEFSLKDSIAVTTMVWSPDGKYIATSSNEDKVIHIWDVQKRERIQEFARTGGGARYDLSWSPDARYLVACDDAGSWVRVVDARDWSAKMMMKSSNDRSCRRTAFSSDSSELAVLGESLTVYSTKDWKQIRFVDLEHGWASGDNFRVIQYLPRTHTVLVGGSDSLGLPRRKRDRDGAVWLFRPEDQTPSHKFWAYIVSVGEIPGGVLGVAVNPSGLQVATGADTTSGYNETHQVTASVHVFDLSTNKLVAAPLDGLGYGPPDGLAYTPDSRYLIIGHGNIKGEHLIHLLDTKTYKIVDVVHTSITIYAVDSSPDSKRFAVAAGDHIYIWSLNSDSKQ